VFSTSTENLDSHGIRANLFTEIQRTLTGFYGYFAPTFRDFDFKGRVYFNLMFGLAIFVKRGIHEWRHGSFFLEGEKKIINAENPVGNHSIKNLQYLEITAHRDPMMIVNFHGLYQAGREDTKETLRQSERMRDFLQMHGGRRLICGDFSIRPYTKSLGLIEGIGFRNLVTDYGIPTTRSDYYTSKKHPITDYVMVTPDISVRSFNIYPDQVSDHLALGVEFE
jgi:hypothetical protein